MSEETSLHRNHISRDAAAGGSDALSAADIFNLAVLIPCFNEEATIVKVVSDFRVVLPRSTIYVYDNNSTDRTAVLATAAGALVRRETTQGKGNVVRRMFADIEADIYILVDGDDTYDVGSVRRMVEHLVCNGLDLLNGRRSGGRAAYRSGHQFGNRLLNWVVSLGFGKKFEDMLSGYKILSRRFVKSFPALSTGFEIETELAVHASELCLPVDEIPIDYRERPGGSESKLRTYIDGIRILTTIFVLLKEEKPLIFFSVITLMLVLLSLGFGSSVVIEYLETGLVPRLPTAVLAMGLMILAMLSLSCGLILDTVTRGRRELKRLHYLSQPALRSTV
ncbi:MAG TPA: glycosyltransferase family 2 protein [Methylocella sp.]|nr:glycosyltransferase family 2 protein [Methylocella sp.]